LKSINLFCCHTSLLILFTRYELVGNKLRPALGGITGAEKLATLRHALVDEVDGDGGLRARTIIKNANIPHSAGDDLIPEPYDIDEGYEQDRWDCETILCAYTLFRD
jgi:hypothetical protein